MDILEELIKSKEKFEKKEIEQLKKLEALRTTKEIYENLNERLYEKFICDIEEKISINEKMLQKCKENKKEIAKNITTIKGCNTKIFKKEKILNEIILQFGKKEITESKKQILEEDNKVIASIMNKIEILKQYRNQGYVNVMQLDIVESNISKMDNENLKEINKNMKSAISVLKGAIKARENAIIKYKKIVEKPNISIRKRNIAKNDKVIISNNENNNLETQKINEEVKTKKIKVRKNNKEEIKIEDENKKSEDDKFELDKALKKYLKDKSEELMLKDKELDEILQIADKLKTSLCDKGYMLFEADEAFRYVIYLAGKQDEFIKREQEKYDKWSKADLTNSLINDTRDEENIAVIESQNLNKEEQEVNPEDMNKEEQEEYAENLNNEEQEEYAEDLNKEEQEEYAEDLNKEEQEEYAEDLNKEEQEVNAEDLNNEEQEIITDKIKQDIKYANVSIEKTHFKQSRISIMEEDRKIDIDGNKIEMNRYLDRETEYTIVNICKKVLGINSKIDMSKNQKKELDKLSEKIDPAIVNAIKETYNGNECVQLLVDYIEAIDGRCGYPLPFKLTYNCSGNPDRQEYKKANKYYNAVKHAGAQIVGKRNVFGFVKEIFRFSASNEEKIDKQNKKIEGDKSFVPKVGINLQTDIIGMPGFTPKIKTNTNQIYTR